MNKSIFLKSSILSAALAIPTFASAQITDEVIVTGSLIKRAVQADSATPITRLNEADIAVTGAKNIADLTQTLTINTGAENFAEAVSQNGTVGTSNINLRGLGVQSTLVLLNGRRQVLAAATTNKGYNFVDTASLVPLIAVQNVDILKDGASSTYGSDAVAGVVNFQTFQNYDGLKLSADYQKVGGFSSDEILLQGLMGKNFKRGNVMAAISYTDKSNLPTSEKRLSRPGIDNTSASGNPGSFIPLGGPLAGGPLANAPLIDAGCAAGGGIPDVIAPGAAFGLPLDVGTCRFDFGEFFDLVPEEEKLTGLLQVNLDLTENVMWKSTFTFADNFVTRTNSPSFPISTLFTPIGGLPAGIVLPNHPNYPAALQGLAPNGALFVGRISGNDGNPVPSTFASNTYRFSTEVSGLTDNDINWNLAFTTAKNHLVSSTEDTILENFACAVRGNCAANGGPDGFFNPFSSSLSTDPNDPAILDFITGNAIRDITSKLTVLEGVVSKVYDSGVGVALGGQYRKEQYEAEFDDISNADGFAFVIGDQDYSGKTDIFAVFAEAIIPVTDVLEVQLAARYETYDGAGRSFNTFDPKAAFIFNATDSLTIRGSASTSFKSPSVYQQNGQGTSLEGLVNPITGRVSAIPVRNSGNPDLEPEESVAYNLGASFAPNNGFEFDVDFFNFDFSNIIAKEDAQTILNNFIGDPTRVESSGPIISQLSTNFINSNSVKTSGIDFSARYAAETGFGTLIPYLTGTYVLSYDIDDPLTGKTEGAGSRNSQNNGVSVPEWRVNAGLGWRYGAHAVNGTLRHVSSYADDLPTNAGIDIDSHTTLDVQYKIDLSGITDTLGSGTAITIGAINVTNEDPPTLLDGFGFDPLVHDPRGRLFYVGVDVEF